MASLAEIGNQGTKEDRPLEGVCLVSDMLTMRLLCIVSNEQKKDRIDLKFLDLIFNYTQMKSTKSGLSPLFLRVLHLHLLQCDLQLVLHLLTLVSSTKVKGRLDDLHEFLGLNFPQDCTLSFKGMGVETF